MKCKARFALEQGSLDEQTPWPPYPAETLWAELIGPRSARLLNSPFYAKGVNYLDEVRVKDADLPPGMKPEEANPYFFEFESVLKRSGHGTVRAILKSEDHRQIAEEAVSAITQAGCTWEGADGGLLSIDIPPGVNAGAVMATLALAYARGAIYVDVGYVPPST